MTLKKVLLGVVLTQVLAAAAFGQKVTIDTGAIEGTTDGPVTSFKGVPFAAPPVGQLRWRAPQRVSPWTGVKAAKEYAGDCMQNPFPGDAAPLGTPPAEDCLYLNVWKPKDAAPGAKLPVMVWIYGGGFTNGGSSPSVYSGHKFAEKGAVLVSFNYRLGRFGFFGFPELTKEDPDGMLGNYGYMDQIAALQWVKRNVAAFGGDPDNVTIFGESAGGYSVHVLLTSPLAQGLFAKAIVESGGGRNNLGGLRLLSAKIPNGPPSAEDAGIAFAQQAGIQGTGKEALDALRKLTADQVTNKLNMANSGGATFAGPMIDGRVVVGDPAAIYLLGGGAAVPILVGANSLDIGGVFGDTKEALFDSFHTLKAQAAAAYDPTGDKDVRVIRGDMGRDRMMIEPARFVADVFASRGLPSYEYRFSYAATSLRDKLTGAPHATEIPFVFDTVAARYGKEVSPADEKIAQQTLAYWVAFAKTGDPGTGNAIAWPRYTPETDMIMDFTAEGPVAKPDPWKARLDVTSQEVSTWAPARPKPRPRPAN